MGVPAPRTAPPATANLLAQVVRLSRRFGADPEFVRAGGGNSSAKRDGVLFIKASGVSLATLKLESLIAFAIEPLLEFLDAGGGSGDAQGSREVLRVAESARVSPADGRRPSVELLFHAMLPDQIVLHTHPIAINTLTCAIRGRDLAERIVGDRALWIPYADPGLPLARVIRDERDAYTQRTGRPAPRALLLQNHGLVVSADTAAEIKELSRDLVALISDHADAKPPSSWGAVARIEPERALGLVGALESALGANVAAGGPPQAVVFDDSPLALAAAGSELGHRFARGGPLTPDQIVYAGSWPLVIGEIPDDAEAAVAALEAAVAERATRDVDPPIIVLVAGVGLFATGDNARQAATARTLYLDAMRIASGAHRLGGVRPLGPDERRFIERWEAEAYRRQIALRAP
jgi:rhamnose utilization protein RhaD (predicted bifunctional aldolase and dehydrogenase)